MLQVKCALIRPRAGNPFPYRESLDPPPLPDARQKVNQRHQQVRLDREPPIGCLDKIAHAYTRDLTSVLLMLTRIAQVLDHRITEHHVEGFIGEGKPASVGEDPSH